MDYYYNIKNILIDNEIYKRVKDYSKNRNELDNYYKIGKLLIEAQGGELRANYGDNLIKEYSKKLTIELNKSFSTTLLKNIRQFYILMSKCPTLSDKLTWSHYVELIWIKDMNKIKYYINISSKYNLSVRELRNRIKLNEYERLDEKTRYKLFKNEVLTIADNLKHPITIKNTYQMAEISEKMLKKLIMEDISSFMKELGERFSFIDSEYKIKIGNNYNYIDILLFNIKYNCYIVVELKVTKLKKEHIGQIQTYMNYIDKNIKTIYQDITIGIIITKHDNKFIMEYCSDDRLFNTTYELI